MARIRPGRIDDEAAIREFTTGTFSWGDYVADEFAGWLGSGDTAVAVATDDADVPIAVARVRMLSAREAWVSAARVHPEHRRKGLGTAINEWCADWARRQGGVVSRLQIETNNEAAQQQVAGLGYRPVVRAVAPQRPAHLRPDANGAGHVPAPERLVRGPKAESDLAFIAWSTSELARRSRGLFAAEPWSWRALSEDDIRRGPMWSCPSGWVIAELDEDELFVGWIASSPDDIDRLMAAIVDLAHDQGAAEIALALPDVEWLTAAWRRLGFVDGHPSFIYEKALT